MRCIGQDLDSLHSFLWRPMIRFSPTSHLIYALQEFSHVQKHHNLSDYNSEYDRQSFAGFDMDILRLENTELRRSFSLTPSF